jgi:hypothetical protein
VLTDGQKFAAATGMPAQLSDREGETFTLFGGRIEGRQIELVPGQRIVQAWRFGATHPSCWDAGVYSVVRFTLSGQQDGTRFIIDHTGRRGQEPPAVTYRAELSPRRSRRCADSPMLAFDTLSGAMAEVTGYPDDPLRTFPSCAPAELASRIKARIPAPLARRFAGPVGSTGTVLCATASRSVLPTRGRIYGLRSSQPTFVPFSKPDGTAWPFFSALNSSRASDWFHSTASPAFGV